MLYLSNYVFDCMYYMVYYDKKMKSFTSLMLTMCLHLYPGLCDLFSRLQHQCDRYVLALSLFFLSFVRSRTSSVCFPAAGPACFCHAGWFCARYKVRSFFRPPHALHFLMRRATVLFGITIHVILHNLHQVDCFCCYFVEISGVVEFFFPLVVLK